MQNIKKRFKNLATEFKELTQVDLIENPLIGFLNKYRYNRSNQNHAFIESRGIYLLHVIQCNYKYYKYERTFGERAHRFSRIIFIEITFASF